MPIKRIAAVIVQITFRVPMKDDLEVFIGSFSFRIKCCSIPLNALPTRISVKDAAVDLVTMFFGKYLPTELSPDLSGHVPDSLIPPPLVLTPEQEYYAGLHLIGFKQLEGKPGCVVALDSLTPDDRFVPYVRFLPQATAAKQVRNADLEPFFTGPTGPGVAWVLTQTAAAGTKVSVGDTVKMELRTGQIP